MRLSSTESVEIGENAVAEKPISKKENLLIKKP